MTHAPSLHPSTFRPVRDDWTHTVSRPHSTKETPSPSARAEGGSPEDVQAVQDWLALSRAGRAPALFTKMEPLIIQAPEVSMAIIGDTGKQTPQSLAIGRSFGRYDREQGLHIRIHSGDIVYETGAKSVDDPQWKAAVEDPFREAGPIHYVRGNHDDNNAEFEGDDAEHGSTQVYQDYARKNPDFIFPGPFYSREVHFQGGSLELFFIDTPILKRHPELAPAIEEALKASKADRKIVVGHHPIYSYGSHGHDPDLMKSLLPIMQAHGDMKLSGHEHDRQINEKDGVLYLVSGTGAEARSTGRGPETVQADTELGWTDVRVSKDAITVRQIRAEDHKVTHTHVHERPEAVARRRALRQEGAAAQTDAPARERRQRKVI